MADPDDDEGMGTSGEIRRRELEEVAKQERERKEFSERLRESERRERERKSEEK